jgi:hypothetical protein
MAKLSFKGRIIKFTPPPLYIPKISVIIIKNSNIDLK